MAYGFHAANLYKLNTDVSPTTSPLSASSRGRDSPGTGRSRRTSSPMGSTGTRTFYLILAGEFGQ